MSLEITIDQGRCKHCGICIDACPIPCFYESGKEIGIFNQNLCLVCRNCEEGCPTACLQVTLCEG
jgi:NAD-dependent dihydropyrimidine dehydrogenase PreA subunit